jgi:hypothetical protein
MDTNKTHKVTTVWHLRVPMTLVLKVRKMAEANKRSVTKQAHVLLEEALNGNQQK